MPYLGSMALHEETFTIRTAETNAAGHARLGTLCQLLQEAAGNHAAVLGFGMGELREENRAWVLHRLQLRVLRFPRRGERVTVRTWPSGGDGLRAWRDFRVNGEKGRTLAVALSHWLMIDLQRRRPVRIPATVMRYAEESEEEGHVLPLPEERLPERSGGEDEALPFRVRREDLDLNDHVNNVRYLEWMLEAVGATEAERDRQPEEMDVEFHAECRYGEAVKAVAGAGPGGDPMAELHKKEEEKLVARGLFRFPA